MKKIIKTTVEVDPWETLKEALKEQGALAPNVSALPWLQDVLEEFEESVLDPVNDCIIKVYGELRARNWIYGETVDEEIDTTWSILRNKTAALAMVILAEKAFDAYQKKGDTLDE